MSRKPDDSCPLHTSYIWKHGALLAGMGALGIFLPFLVGLQVSPANLSYWKIDCFSHVLTRPEGYLMALLVAGSYFQMTFLIYLRKMRTPGKHPSPTYTLVLFILLPLFVMPGLRGLGNFIFYGIFILAFFMGNLVSFEKKWEIAEEHDRERLKLMHGEYILFFNLSVWFSIFTFSGFSWHIYQLAEGNPGSLWRVALAAYLAVAMVFCVLIPMRTRLAEIRRNVKAPNNHNLIVQIGGFNAWRR